MDGNYWNLEYGTSLSRAFSQYKHFVCLEAEDPWTLILEDVGGHAVHWSGPVWSPQSSVLWGWDGQRPLPKLADSACFFFFRMFAQRGEVENHNHLFLQIFPVPESIV